MGHFAMVIQEDGSLSHDKREHRECLQYKHSYHPQTKLREGNIFTSVSQSFCPRVREAWGWGTTSIQQCNGAGGVSIPKCNGAGGSSRGLGASRGECPQEAASRGECIQGVQPEGSASMGALGGVHRGIHPDDCIPRKYAPSPPKERRSTGGRYACYWNAFLFIQKSYRDWLVLVVRCPQWNRLLLGIMGT